MMLMLMMMMKVVIDDVNDEHCMHAEANKLLRQTRSFPQVLVLQ